jgi:hypothetical protein
MSITLRLIKGSELTYSEVDDNFKSLFYSGSLIGTDLTFYYPDGQGGYSDSQTFDLSTLPGFSGIGINDDGSEILPAANIINFTGTGVTVTSTGNTANVEITGGGGGTDTFTNATPMPQNFPGNSPFDNIGTGTTFANKTFTEMMNLMLYPELFPSLTNPSQTNFTLSPSGFREIGEQFSAGGITLSSTFSRGSINPAYTTNGFRSGLPNAYIYTGPGSVPTPQSSTSLTNVTATTAPYTIVQGAQSWTSKVAYDAGQQPLSSTGNNFNSPLPAGQTNNNLTRTITGVYPVFATTVSIGTLTKQALQSMTVYEEVSMVAETGGNKQIIDIPVAWSTINGLQQFNTFSGTWDIISLGTFTPTSITKTIQGVSGIPYNRYTHNGATIGARQLRFTV